MFIGKGYEGMAASPQTRQEREARRTFTMTTPLPNKEGDQQADHA